MLQRICRQWWQNVPLSKCGDWVGSMLGHEKCSCATSSSNSNFFAKPRVVEFGCKSSRMQRLYRMRDLGGRLLSKRGRCDT